MSDTVNALEANQNNKGTGIYLPDENRPRKVGVDIGLKIVNGFFAHCHRFNSLTLYLIDTRDNIVCLCFNNWDL